MTPPEIITRLANDLRQEIAQAGIATLYGIAYEPGDADMELLAAYALAQQRGFEEWRQIEREMMELVLPDEQRDDG